MAFLVPILGSFFFSKTLQLHKFDGADFKYDNSFFKISAQNIQYKIYIVPSLGVLFFRKIFVLGKFEGADFKCNNSFSKNLCPKIQK